MNHTAFFEQVKKGNIQPIYLMEGTEEYIKQQALRQLCTKLLPAGLEELNLTDLTDPEADALIAAAETLPFMADRRIVIIRECSLLTAGKKAERGPSKTEEPPVPAEKQAAEGDGAHGDEPRTEERAQPAPAGEKAGGRAPEGEQQEAGAMPKKIRKGRKRNEKQPNSDD